MTSPCQTLNRDEAVHWTIGYTLPHTVIAILVALVIARSLSVSTDFTDPVFQVHIIAAGAVLAISLTVVPITLLLGKRKIAAGKLKDQQTAAAQEAAAQRRIFPAGVL